MPSQEPSSPPSLPSPDLGERRARASDRTASTLRGRTVLVVGGTSGVGLASARAALELGAAVHLAGRDPRRLAAAADELRERAGLDGSSDTGGQVTGTAVDAEDVTALTALLDAVRPDDVVLTTGEAFSGPLADTPVADVLAYVSSRIAPLLTVARWAARTPGALRSVTVVGGFVLRKPGVDLSSWGFVGPGLVGLVESLAVELAPTRVNEVAPGMIIDSPRIANYYPTREGQEARRIEIEQAAPARHAVTVADVARQVLGFVTDPAITGNLRTVDAGLSLV